MIVSRKAFADAVNHALVGVSARPQLPILAGVKLEAADGYLTAIGYDGATQATALTPVDGDLPTTLVNGALLKDIVTKSKADNMSLELEGNDLLVEAGRAKVRLQTMPTGEYPKPLLTPEAGFTLDGSGWDVIARTVAHAASKEDSIPVLTAMNISVGGGQLTAETTDRYRLAQNSISIDDDFDGAFTIAAKTVLDISKHLDTAASWQVRVSDTLVAVNDGRSQIIRALVDGEFPNVSRLYPKDVLNEATANRDELVDSISRATSLLERNDPVRLTFDGDTITVDAGADGRGAMTEQLDCHGFNGDPATLRFNPVYITEALNALDSDEVKIGWNDTVKPTKITGSDADHQQLVMPIRA